MYDTEPPVRTVLGIGGTRARRRRRRGPFFFFVYFDFVDRLDLESRLRPGTWAYPATYRTLYDSYQLNGYRIG